MILQHEFEVLADIIERDSAGLSTMIHHTFHDYMFNFGTDVLRYVFKDMWMNGRYLIWFNFLRRVTGENPVKPEHIGKPELMAKDWLEWAKANNYDYEY
jgi:hypothetical protein